MCTETIAVEDIAIGMFVVDVGEGTFDAPRTKVGTIMRTGEQLDRLRALGVKTARIDPDKARQLAEAEPAPSGTPASFPEDVREMDQRMAQAVALSRSMMRDVRLGRAVHPEQALPLVEGMIESAFRNESAAVFLTKLGNYDDYTYMHCVNVMVLASVFGRHMGLDDAAVRSLGLAGLLHDLGKALVPDAILNKPGRLTEEELAVMRTHPRKGYALLRGVRGLAEQTLLGALEHHEKWNGEGYPDGKKAESISIFARMLSIVDVYDAMTSNRVYHKGRAETDVLAYLFQNKDDFAPGYVERFVKTVGIYPPGTLVRLSDGSLALVCMNTARSLLPAVAMVNRESGRVDAKVVRLETLQDAGKPVSIVEVLDRGAFPVDISGLRG
ncbi:MAG: HD-GYP domain-containing protein [Desulfovibrionaceae bacterium]